jgi:hypothetical protein
MAHITVDRRSETMGAGWKVFWLAAFVCILAYVAARILVPDVVPIGYAEEAEPSWAVLTAFALRAIELTGLWVAAIAFAVMLGVWLKRQLRRVISPDTRHRPSRSNR